MPDLFTHTQLIFALIFSIAFMLGVGYLLFRRARTRGFRARFGPEYERAILAHGSSRNAEAKLADREAHVRTLKLRDLAGTERERFVAQWRTVQARFVDHPKSAVSEADLLISALLVALGYSRGSFERRAADISVSYPRLMEDYRRANAVAVRPGRADASTEELRKAMIQYHRIFDELIRVPRP
jgi:hypothetical protein